MESMRHRLVLALVLAGCSSPAEGTPCEDSGECDAGFACVDGECVERPDAGRRDAGTCTDCECVTAEDCPPVAPCAQTACEDGACRIVENDSFCAPAGVCDAQEGCVAPPEDAGVDGGAAQDAGAPGSDAGPPIESSVGGPCTDDAECPTDLGFGRQCALSYMETEFPGGYCTTRCFDAPSCDEGSVCWDGGGFVDRYCLRRCRTDADCRESEGYVCGTPSVGTLAVDATVCVPSGL